MIYRVDVYGRTATDPAGEAVRRQLVEAGYRAGPIRTRRIYLLDTDATADAVRAAAAALLADPIAESADVYDDPARLPTHAGSLVEVHLKPGVMDPVAASAGRALGDLGLATRAVRTGRAFAFEQSFEPAALEAIAKRYLANSVVEHVCFAPQLPASFAAARVAGFDVRRVPIRERSDDQLATLSRDGHLFLNVVEMRAIQSHYRTLGREPTDVELETLAQTWSEHCVHKTLKSAVEVVDESGTVVRRYGNLIKETIFQSTMDLIRIMGVPPMRSDGQGARRGSSAVDEVAGHERDAHATKAAFCLSVFKDNAGVIAFDDDDAVCFKVETHNRPSAIEPYGGAATGIGGCIRDVLGTGLAARPIANTNVFCVAPPDAGAIPNGVIHPKRTLQQVVAGVRDYGNRMGIPTVNGAVHFDDRYVGNPLVFAGCVGILPRDKIDKKVGRGDRVVVMGGRTGRDGIHGATFSSAAITSTAADEFSHAVQIGNAIAQKALMDVLLQARDAGLYSAVTDCGAGGLSSAIGEMGADVGASVDLDLVPLKYAGLRYDEIWISEAQERMVLSVPAAHVDALLKLSTDENVESTVIGTFGTDGEELILRYHGTEVARMAMTLLHDGIPMPTRRAFCGTGFQPVADASRPQNHGLKTHATRDALLSKLADPNVASKHWIVRQYDHEVQGGTVVKPLVGPRQIGPSDAAVIRPKSTSTKGVVLSNGLVIGGEESDPYATALASIDEAIRNAVCVGARLDTLAILDNFCWPGVHDERSMGTLVRACEACRDGALGYRVPFISGKDSLHNQFTDARTGRVTRIPCTLLVSAIGVIDDVGRCVTSDFKRAGNMIVRVWANDDSIASRRATHAFVSDLIAAGHVRAAHDVSDGGEAACVAEMCIGSGLGADVVRPTAAAFDEPAATYLLEMPDALPASTGDVNVQRIGTVTADATLRYGDDCRTSVDELTAAWRGTLDW